MALYIYIIPLRDNLNGPLFQEDTVGLLLLLLLGHLVCTIPGKQLEADGNTSFTLPLHLFMDHRITLKNKTNSHTNTIVCILSQTNKGFGNYVNSLNGWFIT